MRCDRAAGGDTGVDVAVLWLLCRASPVRQARPSLPYVCCGMRSVFFCCCAVVCGVAHAGDVAARDIVTVDVVALEAPWGDPAVTLQHARENARAQALQAVLQPLVVLRHLRGGAGALAAAREPGLVVEETFEGPFTRGDGYVKLGLHARYDLGWIREHLCSVIKANHDPKISVVAFPSTAETDAAAAAVTAVFARACFSSVAVDDVVPAAFVDGAARQAFIDALVKHADAQYVALVPPSSGLKVAVLNTSTNDYEAVCETARGDVDGCVDALLSRMVKRWEDGGDDFGGIAVTVASAVTKATLTRLVQRLQAWKPTTTVTVRVRGPERTTFDVGYPGGVEAFATRLESEVFDDVEVEVLEVVRGKVVLKLNPKAKTTPKNKETP